MKRYIFPLLLLAVLVPISLLQAQTIKVYYRDGTILKIPVEEVQSIKPYAPDHFYVDGHEYVDLGLSVCWATCNVGANSPEEYGGYYAWGELEEKEVYTMYSYNGPWAWKTGTLDTLLINGNHFTGPVYNISGTQYDVAHTQWGENWHIPTYKEFEELFDSCRASLSVVNGINGLCVSGKNMNCIFLPGNRYGYQNGSAETFIPDIPCHIKYFLDDHSVMSEFFFISIYQGTLVRPVTNVKPDYKKGILITKTNGVEIDIPEEELDSIVGFAGYPYGIPEDDDAEPNPDIEDPNTVIPNPHGTLEWEGVDLIFRLDMTGIQDPNDPKTWLQLYGTGSPDQNIWVSIDGQPKGFVISNIDDETVPADIVFLVDNSGSMSQEADVIARDIISWAQYLLSKNLDVRFGCVGYSENGEINGAFDLNDANALSSYLNTYSGTKRTQWFSGDNAISLKTAASTYKVRGECGGMALQFANSNLSYRDNANRIYVNFTDEPNQPNNVAAYSVEWFNPGKSNWPASKGTVHTVYSDGYNAIIIENPNYSEDPAKFSSYTGGTIIKTNSTLSGVTLNDLPITSALTNSYIIRMTNVMGVADGNPHEVKITILSKDGTIRGERIFSIVIAPKEKEE